MRKIFLATALVLLGSLRASGVASNPNSPLSALRSPPQPPPARAPISILNGQNQHLDLHAPFANVPSTPIQITPRSVQNPSITPEYQGSLGPQASSQVGLGLGFPFGSTTAKRGSRGMGPVPGMLAQRLNAK